MFSPYSNGREMASLVGWGIHVDSLLFRVNTGLCATKTLAFSTPNSYMKITLKRHADFTFVIYLTSDLTHKIPWQLVRIYLVRQKYIKNKNRSTWVAQLVKCLTIGLAQSHDLAVVGSSPTLGSALSKESS